MPVASPRTLSFFVEGVPITQGSMTPRRVKVKGRWTLRNTHPPKLDGWRALVRLLGREAMTGPPIDAPLVMLCSFFLVRPPTVKRPWPSSQRDGDADKYLRAIGDALEGVAFKNDGRIVASAAVLAYHDQVGLEGPGVFVEVAQLDGRTPWEVLARLLT